VVALAGAFSGDLGAVGLAYFGIACAVAFAHGSTYRSVLSALASQAAGALVGLGVAAATPESPVVLVATAGVAAMVSGLVGSLSPAAPGFGMMLSIGLAYGQFSGSSLPWWSQCLWYLIGTVAVAVVWLAPWSVRRGAIERKIAASVFDAAADLCDAIGGAHADEARARLAAASATARTASRNAQAELVAFAVAALHAEGAPVPGVATAAVRTAASRTRRGESSTVAINLDPSSPGLDALVDALSATPTRPPAPVDPGLSERAAAAIRSLVSADALTTSARMSVCLGLATAATVALHGQSHSFWLPLTVAVIIRPEYASIFVRTVNRLCGTLIGAAGAALVLAVISPGAWVAVAAALALAFAVLTSPKLYAFSVIGITASALLSSCIGSSDEVLPMLRVLDTVLGAAIALVVGYLLWPRARRLSESGRLRTAIDAADVYLADAGKGSSPALQRPRDDAYRLAHRVRQNTECALSELPPVNQVAAKQLPRALELERLVDDITRVVTTVDAGERANDDAARIADRLRALREPYP
jgi:hypothetical protein